MAAIRLSGVDVTFATASGPIRALSDVAIEIPKGQFCVLIGPSGCGKSTLLRVMADLQAPDQGEVQVFGGKPCEARRARRISFVFQEATLLPWRSVIDNVRLPLQVGNWKSVGRPHRDPNELVRLVGLGGRESALPHQLSGGQRQRVAIARALVTRPDVLLMDEPFGALDEITRERLNEEMLNIWQETGTTIVFVTHSLSEAAFLGQSVAVMAAHPGRMSSVIDLQGEKPVGAMDRSSSKFFDITSNLRRHLETAEGMA
ncbi:ABC transporter ATP-binding protein [Aminobacter sp. Y103A]|uniref:ABC transporter ATP-binding protein n=1 Tax=Aminobacter sp. Y103A TaxID=1870862 RepID=UPI00257284D2|nr:ABC transporter ATP-binding protein [Aminobacter sp. SS-2016]BBD40237.1 ABC transporter ATP-binding protein [Aminobacter sp. SS-2016]